MDSTIVNNKWPCRRRRRALLRNHCYFFQHCCTMTTTTTATTASSGSTATTTTTTTTISTANRHQQINYNINNIVSCSCFSRDSSYHDSSCSSSIQVHNYKRQRQQQQRINRITPIFIVIITIFLFPNILLFDTNLHFVEYVHGKKSMMMITRSSTTTTIVSMKKKIKNKNKSLSQKIPSQKHRIKIKKKQHHALPNQNFHQDQAIVVDDKRDGKQVNTAQSKEVLVVETTTSTLLSKLSHLSQQPSTIIQEHPKRKLTTNSKKNLKKKKKKKLKQIAVNHQSTGTSTTKLKKKMKLKKVFKSSTLPTSTTFTVDAIIDDATGNSLDSIIRVPREDKEEILFNIDQNNNNNNNNTTITTTQLNQHQQQQQQQQQLEHQIVENMNENKKNYNYYHHQYRTRESTSTDNVMSLLYDQDEYCIIDNVPVSPWVYHFLSKVSKSNNNDYIVPLPKDYCSDPFNLVQLPSIIESIGRQEQQQQQQQQQQQLRRNTSYSTKVDCIKINNNSSINNNQPVSMTTSFNNSSTTILNNANNKKNNDKYLIYKQALRLIVDDNLSWVISTYNRSTSTDSTIRNDNNGNDVDPTLLMYNEYILDKYLPSHIENAAIALYYLLHQRYVTSPRGIEFLYSKFITSSRTNNNNNHDIVMSDHLTISSNSNNYKRHQHGLFGRCPRQQCRGAYMLPIGDSDDFHNNYHMSTTDSQSSDMTNSCLTVLDSNQHYVKRYCPICNEVFYNWDTIINGCAWGVSFCNLFLLQYGDTVYQSWLSSSSSSSSSLYDNWSDKNSTTSVDVKKKVYPEYNRIFSSSTTATPSTQEYEPRIFGFRVHPQILVKFRNC